MIAFDDLPDLLPHAPWLLVALVLVFWVYMKVRLVRQRLTHLAPGEEPEGIRRWQLWLARAEHTNLVLAALAAGLMIALAWFGVFVPD